MKYELTFQFNLFIETGDKNINELIRIIEDSYSNNLIGEKTTVVKIIKKHDNLFNKQFPNW